MNNLEYIYKNKNDPYNGNNVDDVYLNMHKCMYKKMYVSIYNICVYIDAYLHGK
jgi:hypothetical protein